MTTIGKNSYNGSDSEYSSLGKEFTQDEIRDIIFHNLRSKVYSDQEEIDNILFNIKNVCFLYLDDKTYIEDLNITDVENTLIFLSEQLDYLSLTQEKLEIIDYSWPFTELVQAIDEFTLSGDKDTYVHELINGKLAKDLSIAFDLTKFCYGVMSQIKNDLINSLK